MPGCNAGGFLDVTHYSRPLPWIGLYVAGASLLCAAAMALDAYSGFRRRKLWFPSRLFSLNAATLTLLGVATKFPVDLNTSMPGRADQLTKLSGTVLICTAIANSMPSLGAMDYPEILSNVVALGIMVVTVVVNVCIQMRTGVIYVFLPEHPIVMLLMVVVLALLISSALTVATSKNLLDQLYTSQHVQSSESDGGADGPSSYPLSELKGHVRQYWLMAHTSNPQYVLGRSATCTAAGAFCLLGCMVLAEAVLRSLVQGSNMGFCSGTSDYQWSTTLVLVAQAAGVLAGTVAPAYRWFNAVSFRSPEGVGWSCRDELKVEKYWVERLNEWREGPLPFEISLMWRRKVAHFLKNSVLAALIRLQEGVVVASKCVRLASVLPMHWLREGARLLWKKGTTRSPPEDTAAVRPYVLHLEGEEDLVKLVTRSERKDTEKLMEKGRRKQPAALVELITSHSTARQGFSEVGAFDSGVASLVTEEPPNCWALPVVTLAAIAVTLPGVDKDQVDRLLRGVSQGLRFVRLVERNLDQQGLVNMRDAADIVWSGVDLNRCWLDLDLRRLARRGNNADGKQIVEEIEKNAKDRVVGFLEELKSMPEANRPKTESWPEKVLAANCMYRVCATILADYDTGKHQTDDHLFAWLQTVIADVLGACLTNLPRAIFLECSSNPIEAREKGVRDAALSLGEAEGILEFLEDPNLTGPFPVGTQYIDDWRSRAQMLP